MNYDPSSEERPIDINTTPTHSHSQRILPFRQTTQRIQYQYQHQKYRQQYNPGVRLYLKGLQKQEDKLR